MLQITRREGFTVQRAPTIVGCLDGGMKELKDSLKRIFGKDKDNHKGLDIIAREMQKTVLWESESLIRKVLSGLST